MRKLIISLCIILLTACAQDTSEQPENWEVNELFTQLSELRKEIKLLKSDVQGLKDDAVKRQNNKNNDNKKTAIEIDLSNIFPLGKDDAKYAIIEFTDYQCPYCSKHSKKTLPKIKQIYIDTGILKYFIKDFPLGFHDQAKNAAISVRCSGQQGKYWEMHDLIFANNKQLSEKAFSAFATQLNIDVSLFKECLNNPEIIKAVENDISEGELIGVQGTPAFFIGRVKDNKLVDIRALYGAQSFSVFSSVINTLTQE